MLQMTDIIWNVKVFCVITILHTALGRGIYIFARPYAEDFKSKYEAPYENQQGL